MDTFTLGIFPNFQICPGQFTLGTKDRMVIDITKSTTLSRNVQAT